jgi:hypothetical protein
MAEHSHEVVAHLYHVQLPYRMDGQGLEFEPAVRKFSFRECLQELTLSYSEEEIRRILVGTVALLEKFPHRSLGEALDTAMVWERG